MYTQSRPTYNMTFSNVVVDNWNFLFVNCSVTVRPIDEYSSNDMF